MFLGDDQEGLPLGWAPVSAGVVGASSGQLQLAGVADSARAALQVRADSWDRWVRRA